MATYRITGPDGASYKVTAPDGVGEEEVFKTFHASMKRPALKQANPEEYDPQSPEYQAKHSPTAGSSFGQNAVEGIGKAFTDLGRGVGQKLGIVSTQDIAEARRLDAPLMKTAGGVTGNIGGNIAMIAPTALIPGANTVAGAAAVGGVVGALQPYESTKEALLNPVLGAAGGAAGQAVANRAGAVVQDQLSTATKTAKAVAPKVQAAEKAAASGYVIPPADLPGAGKIAEAVSGLSGKIKTAQEASARNQPITNALAKKALGIADDAPLNPQTLNQLRADAGQAYQVVKGTGTVSASPQYAQALDGIASKYTAAAKDFPGAVKNEVGQMVEALKQPSFSAEGAVDMTKVLRETADSAFRKGDTGLGKAAKEASKALEDELERHLATNGTPNALAAFREARQQIAKTYTVEKALNPATGDVSAQVLANELKRKKPLSGELRTIAEAGLSFPKATQALKETPKSLSPLDFGAAGIGLAGSGGNPLAALGLVARPAARSAILSGPIQRRAVENAGRVGGANPLARLLSNEQLTMPIGVFGGSQIAQQ
jgi:hypothetical protein